MVQDVRLVPHIYQALALAIVDEQHRFGVRERLALTEKGDAVDVLVLSATPIPRTLVLTYFGDMDISELREKPAGRQPIETRTIHRPSRSDGVTKARPESFTAAAQARVCRSSSSPSPSSARPAGSWRRQTVWRVTGASTRQPGSAVEHAARLDPARMSFPVAEDAGLRRTVYLDESVFRAGRRGIEDAVEALAKLQRHAGELTGRA